MGMVWDPPVAQSTGSVSYWEGSFWGLGLGLGPVGKERKGGGESGWVVPFWWTRLGLRMCITRCRLDVVEPGLWVELWLTSGIVCSGTVS